MTLQRSKTATYSTTGPLMIGLSLATATPDPTLHDALTRYGTALGLTFGLTDDLLGMFGVQETIGKPTCTDLHQARPTALFHYARRLLTGADAKLFARFYGHPHDPSENLAPIRAALIRCGARDRVSELAAHHAAEAKAALAGLTGPAIQALAALPAAVLNRSH